MEPITHFRGDYAFLSNFYPCIVKLDLDYPSAEHAYVAHKSSSPQIREHVARIVKPGDAKRYGRGLQLDPTFSIRRKTIMRTIIEAKFTQNPALMDMLRQTGSRTLIEGNSHGDRYWGHCPLGEGQNNLGIILMEVRDSPFL